MRTPNHALDSVPMRFYQYDWDSDNFFYEIEYLDGANFAEELAHFAQEFWGRQVQNAWFEGRIMYVDVSISDQLHMLTGSVGELIMLRAFEKSLASVPEIDAFVILVHGTRWNWQSGHGFNFRDVYLVADFVE